MKSYIFPLTLGGLAIGTTEFVMMGILPELAHYFQISISEAGHFIALYALGVVIGAPLLILLAGQYNPKKILFGLMILFTVFNTLSLFSTHAAMMNISRFLSGLPHGAFFGVGSIMASRLAKPGKEAKNIAMMFSGLTLANLIMVPLGTYLAQAFTWHWSMGLVSIFGLITCISVYFWLPNITSAQKPQIQEELTLFKNKAAWIIILMVAIGTGGAFAWLSYISKLMTESVHLPAEFVSYVMILIGLGMFVGNFIGGRLADKISPIKACTYIFTALSTTLFLIFALTSILWIVLLLCFLAGALSFALVSPIQILMIKTAGKAEMAGACVTQAAFNIGNSIGAFLGGLVLSWGWSYQFPTLVGAFLALTGIGFTFWLHSTLTPSRKTILQQKYALYGGQ